MMKRKHPHYHDIMESISIAVGLLAMAYFTLSFTFH